MAVAGAIFIALILLVLLVPESDITNIVNNINSLDKELTYAIEDIDASFDTLAEEELDTLGSIERVQNELSKINEKTKIVKAKTEEIQKEINKLKELDLTEEYIPFIEKLSEAYNKYDLYAKSIEEVTERLDKFLGWLSHYIKWSTYQEEIAKNEELIASYLEIENYDKVKEILVEQKEKIILAKNELFEANKLIEFSFSTKISSSLVYYGNYSDSVTDMINYVESEDFDKILLKANEASNFYYKSQEELPTESEISEELDKWYNENIDKLINQADTYRVEADRSYNDAFEIYENI